MNLTSLLPTPTDTPLSRSKQRQAAPESVASVGCPRSLKPPALSIRVLRSVAELRQWLPAWERLARHTLEPNVFFEPWLLLPAVEAYGGADLQFVLVTQGDSGERLCGFFPLQAGHRFRRVPAATLRLWEHPHCYVCTPLLDARSAREVLAAFLDWLPAAASVAEFPRLAADGLVAALLGDLADERGQPRQEFDVHSRALFRPRATGEEYLRAALSSDHRKDLRRKERRLAEQGSLRYDLLAPGEDVDAWIAAFLDLEAGGWKGREGTALACEPVDRRFFESVARQAFRRGRLWMMALRLDERPIAMSCHFTAGSGSYYFKTAFDERFAASSPGRLLEVEKIRQRHASRDLDWEDSCTRADNQQLNVLWLDRRTVASVAVSSGTPWGNLVVAGLPRMQRLYRKWFKNEVMEKTSDEPARR